MKYFNSKISPELVYRKEEEVGDFTREIYIGWDRIKAMRYHRDDHGGFCRLAIGRILDQQSHCVESDSIPVFQTIT